MRWFGQRPDPVLKPEEEVSEEPPPEPAFDQAWLDEAKAETACTPDHLELEAKQHVRVFFYNGMMRGYPMFERFVQPYLVVPDQEKCPRTTWAWTREKFHLFNRVDGTLPVVFEQMFSSASIGRIKGQLFHVRPQCFFDIDNLLQNGNMFVRAKATFVVPFRKIVDAKDPVTMAESFGVDREEGALITTRMLYVPSRAWIYFGKKDYWSTRIDGGFMYKPGRLFIPKNELAWLEPYYFFSKKDLET